MLAFKIFRYAQDDIYQIKNFCYATFYRLIIDTSGNLHYFYAL